MKAFYTAAPWVGLTGSIIVTTIMATGFVTAPETRYAKFRAMEMSLVAKSKPAETITVTATRLVPTRQTQLASICVSATC